MKSKIKSSLFVILVVVLSLNNLAHAVEGAPLRCMKTKTFQIPDNDRQVVEEPKVSRSEHVEVAGSLSTRIAR